MDCEKIRFYPSKKKQKHYSLPNVICSPNFQPPLADSKLMVLKQPEQEMKLMFPQSNNLQTKRQRGEKNG